MNRYENFECHTLDDDGNLFFCGTLPERLRVDADGFETLWRLHPEAYQIIKMFGQPVPTPRWQQAYGADYLLHRPDQPALPLPEECRPILAWSRRSSTRSTTACCSTGMTGNSSTTSGRHNDNTKNMIVGAPIVTISLGEERIFRLSHPKTKSHARLHGTGRDGVRHALRDEPQAWKHAVPHFAHCRGRRISITIRAFEVA